MSIHVSVFCIGLKVPAQTAAACGARATASEKWDARFSASFFLLNNSK